MNTGEDVYVFTNQKELVSLNETINGVVGVKLNVAPEVINYFSTFATKFSFGFDGRKMYLYAQPDSTTAGVMCVYDILYKFWSIWT